MKKIIISVFVISVIFGCSNSNNKKISSKDENINKTLDSLVKLNKVPGVNFSVIFKNGEQKNFSSGYSNKEEKEKLSSNHIMFSGSIGKTYAAALLLQLVDEGKVELNKKIKDYFPETDWLDKLPNIEHITVELLLQHRTGLPRYAMKKELWDTVHTNPDKVWTYKDRFSFVFGDEPLHEAGKGWAYSDTNYLLIGMLIEKITETYYYDELKKRIFTQANLFKTYPSDKRKYKNLATGYSDLPDTFYMPKIVVENETYCFNSQMEWTGGGIISTTSDLAMWAKKFYEGELFSDSLMNKVITPNKDGKAVIDNLSYGMGSFIVDTNHGKTYGHTGFVPGFQSIFAYYPEYKLAVALQVNCDYASKTMSLYKYLDEIVIHCK